MPRAAQWFRHSRFLVAHWQEGSCLISNYRRRTTVRLSERLFAVVDYLGADRSAADVAERFRLSLGDARQLLSDLSSCGLVEPVARDGTRDEQNGAWAPWDPAAGFFHFATRDTAFNVDLVEGERALRRKAERTPPPLTVKPRGRSPATKLGVARSSALTDVLRRRRTWRSFAATSLTKSAVSTLLKFTFGAETWAVSPVHGRVPLKTAPSGGACHPIEAYVAAISVAGVKPGLYHYGFDRHELDLITAGTSRRDLENWIQAQPWFWDAPLVVFLTAVFQRTMWRYPSARAYRNVLLEAGHLCQTFCVLATDLGLAPFCTHALHDSRIDAALGLDGVSEGVIYAAGCGVKPPEGWSPDIPGVTERLE